jgi:hypothetical protein
MPMTTRLAATTLVLAAALMFGGCVSVPWHPTAGPYTSEADNFAVELPKGWMRLNSEHDLLITRDGLLLQHVLIERGRVEQPLKHTKKMLTRGMQPQAVAEVILDNITSSERTLDVKVKENRPIQLGQHRGFRIVYGHRDKNGLRFKSVLLGFLAGDDFYLLRYTAAERYYFSKDLATFEQLVTTFKLMI